MPFFETPKLQDIVLVREFHNKLTDRISSKPWKNAALLKLHGFLEKHYLGINPGITVREYSFKSHLHVPHYTSNDTGYFRHYDSVSDRIVIVVPQRGGGYNPARLVAAYLSSNGFDVYEIVTPFHEKRLPKGITSVAQLPVDVQTIKLTFMQAVEEILGLIELIAQEKVGIVGISQGTSYSIDAGIDSRIKSSVYVHGFGHLADLLLYSDDRFARHFRKEEIKRRGAIDEQLLWEEFRNIEPVNYARMHTSASLMINAKGDKSIPQANIRALWEALGKPELHMFRGGHLGVAIRTKRILEIILEHFEKTL